MRQRRYPIPVLTEGMIARFWSKVAKGADDACWLWTAGRQKPGTRRQLNYGVFSCGRVPGEHQVQMNAHRFSYLLAFGTLPPPGQVVCHRCDVPFCVNPAHLWSGTYAQNSQDAARKGRLSVKKPRKVAYDLIRTARDAGASVVELSRRFGVSTRTITRALAEVP